MDQSSQPGPLPHFALPPRTPDHLMSAPKTPELRPSHTPAPPALEPPRPPRLRIKRRHPSIQHGLKCHIPSADHALPTIELSEPAAMPAQNTTCSALLTPTEGLLSPAGSVHARAVSPPKTPVHQMASRFDDTPTRFSSSWTGSSRLGLGISRPPSAWSDFSDASTGSSQSSFDSMPSFGDSCTSPESDADPFTFPETRAKLLQRSGSDPLLGSPMQLERAPKRDRAAPPKMDWTPEMDEHIWLTYVKYLQDPRVTPFKTLPGSAPPLGVCCRVAREAKKTWKHSRVHLGPIPEHRPPGEFASIDETLMRHEQTVCAPDYCPDSPNTIRPDPTVRSLSASDAGRKKWTATSRQTRHRLRALCKRKPQLSPHYQRLMQSRSPSPMESSSSAAAAPSSSRASPPPAPRAQSDPFSTRDMNFTLATSTAASMQPGGPLAQLSSDASHLQPQPQSDHDPSLSRANPHQKSQSLQLGLGLGQPCYSRLASPFQERRAASEAAHPSMSAGSSSSAAPAPHLEIHHPRPMSGSMKRRAQYQLGEELFSDDPEVRRDHLEDMFRDPAGGLRRVRMRGFSMGAVHQQPQQNYRNLSELFTPPSTGANSSSTEVSDGRATWNAAALLQPPSLLAPATRLGSPFAPQSTQGGFSNTFPRSLFPQGLSSLSSYEDEPMNEPQTPISSTIPEEPVQPASDQHSSSSSTLRDF